MTQNIETTNATPPPKPKKFLDRLRDELRLRHYSFRTEQSYVGWTRRFILFHQKRHPEQAKARQRSAPISSHRTKKPVRAYVSAATKTALFNFHQTAIGGLGANSCHDLTGEKLLEDQPRNRRSLRHKVGEAIRHALSQLPTTALMGQY